MGGLTHFDQIYTPEVLSRIRAKVSANEHDRDVIYFLTGENEGALMRRRMFDKYLEVGFRHGAVDADLQSRLQCADFEQFYQARNELQAAYYFETELKLKIQFRPKGSHRSIGEFEIISNGSPPIFVEVKSPIREWQGDSFYGDEGKTILSSLNQARRQLPKDGRPTLILLSGQLRIPIGNIQHSGLSFSLYGNAMRDRNQLILPDHPRLAGIPQEKRFFSPTANTRVSAVATLEDLITSPRLNSIARNYIHGDGHPIDLNAPMNEFKFRFHVLNNPFPSVSLPVTLFDGSPQLIRSSQQNVMTWVPSWPE